MRLQSAFDAIVEEWSGEGPGIQGFDGSFLHERSPENEHMTAALFATKMLGVEGLQAFYDKGGRFTDQRDLQGRNVLDIMKERLAASLALEPIKAQHEIKEALDLLDRLIIIQGGLIPVKVSWMAKTGQFLAGS